MKPSETKEFVEAVRRKLYPGKRDDESIPGKDVAFNITKHVCYYLRHLGYGLVKAKPGSENNHDGYTTDVIAVPTGYHIDIIGDSGGKNTAVWIPHDKPNEMDAIAPRVVPPILVPDIFSNGHDEEGNDMGENEEINRLKERVAILEKILNGEVEFGLRSSKNNQLVCTDDGDHLVANREHLQQWEKYRIVLT